MIGKTDNYFHFYFPVRCTSQRDTPDLVNGNLNFRITGAIRERVSVWKSRDEILRFLNTNILDLKVNLIADFFHQANHEVQRLEIL